MINDIPTSHSCRICQRLVIDLGEKDDAWVERTLALRHESQPSDKARQGRLAFRELMALRDASQEHPIHIPTNEIIFDFSVGEIREAVDDNCLLLHFLKTELLESNSPGPDGQPGDDHILACLVNTEDLMFFTVTKSKVLQASSLQMDHASIISVDPGSSWYYSRQNQASLEAYVPAGTEASKHMSTRPFNAKPSSVTSIVMMQSWLSTCLASHSSCPRPDLDFLPTRLISIPEEQDGNVHLWCTEGQKVEPYAALSYCWGQQAQTTTTVDSIQRHLKGFAIDSLPRTIQEAIKVARGLGIPNLWVDSLCIIQDDCSDKAVEIAQMPLVYSQATLVISAARSKGVHEGFLGDRSDIFEDHFQLPYRRLDGGLEAVSIFNVDTRGSEPLDSRAWALQEKFLATRLLEFGRCQTRWTCQSRVVGTLIDGYKHYIDVQHATDGLSRAILSLLRGEEVSSSDMYGTFPYVNTSFMAPGSEGSRSERPESVGSHSSSTSIRSLIVDWPPSKPYNIWRNLVEIYNVRELTLQSDRLPAISGLASRFAELIDDHYCAGIWKSRLPHDLLWHMYSEDNDGQAQRCQGPSWSWASAPGSLYYKREYDHLDTDASFQVVNSQIELVDEHNLYGAVHSGTLVVQGRLRDAAWYWEASRWQADSGIAVLQKSRGKISGEDKLPVKLMIDYPSIQNKQSLNPIILLPIKSYRRRRRGLVLEHISDEQYARVGVFHTSVGSLRNYGLYNIKRTDISDKLESHEAWFEDGEVRTIAII